MSLRLVLWQFSRTLSSLSLLDPFFAPIFQQIFDVVVHGTAFSTSSLETSPSSTSPAPHSPTRRRRRRRTASSDVVFAQIVYPVNAAYGATDASLEAEVVETVEENEAVGA